MQKIIEDTKKELELIENSFKEVSSKLEDVNKLLKKSSYDKKALENELHRLRGISQGHTATLKRLETPEEVEAELVK